MNHSNEEEFKKDVSIIEDWIFNSNKVNSNSDDLKITIEFDSYGNLIYHIKDIAQLTDNGKILKVYYDGMNNGYVDSFTRLTEVYLLDWLEDYPKKLFEENQKNIKKLNKKY